MIYMAGKISYDDALSSADSNNEVRLMIKLGTEKSHIIENNAMRLTATDDHKNDF